MIGNKHSMTTRVAIALGTGVAALGISLAGTAGVASAKPCPSNCHDTNPKPKPPIDLGPVTPPSLPFCHVGVPQPCRAFPPGF
ncbi:hypothetical protein JGU71_23490 [Antrihabitans sp. YC3-6]|uniref:Intersectin-EH binding protein Ibp1 n=1 Tax=Antrihabitans stalagmiti TaxID=2799499 RepID=A0A934NV48_9NOCA|nr:hypothetical protein [Antrihabitans stalagmiti]MBJ8341854.1 hypothetical protein [Antrihabitans stalagmiti]